MINKRHMHWIIELIGDNFDLDYLSKITKDQELSIVQENGIFILKSTEFINLSDYEEVKSRLNELLNSLNAIVKFTLDSQNILSYKISKIDENGVKILFVESHCVGIGRSFALLSINGILIHPPVEEWIKLASMDPIVKRVFTQINHNGFNSWIALYNVIEILQQGKYEHIGRNGKYGKIAGAICQKAESYQELKENARHPGRDYKGPTLNIEFPEAKDHVKKFIIDWLAQKQLELLDKNE